MILIIVFILLGLSLLGATLVREVFNNYLEY